MRPDLSYSSSDRILLCLHPSGCRQEPVAPSQYRPKRSSSSERSFRQRAGVPSRETQERAAFFTSTSIVDTLSDEDNDGQLSEPAPPSGKERRRMEDKSRTTTPTTTWNTFKFHVRGRSTTRLQRSRPENSTYPRCSQQVTLQTHPPGLRRTSDDIFGYRVRHPESSQPRVNRDRGIHSRRAGGNRTPCGSGTNRNYTSRCRRANWLCGSGSRTVVGEEAVAEIR